MKFVYYILMFVMFLSSCEENNLLPIPVADMFPDDNFREYVLHEFDEDNNGMISQLEAESVVEININGAGDPFISPLRSLQGIEIFSNLKVLSCFGTIGTAGEGSNAILYELDLTHNTKLEYLACSGNALRNLDLSNNPKLKYLACIVNYLEELNLDNNTELEELYCYNNNMKHLFVSKCTALISLYCQNNRLHDLDISNNRHLEYVNCTNNDDLSTIYVWQGFKSVVDNLYFNRDSDVLIEER